jgi:ligand-binding sensor domain-containing protein
MGCMPAPTRLLLTLLLMAIPCAALEAAHAQGQAASSAGLVPTVRVETRPRIFPVVDATDIAFSQLSSSNARSQTRVGQIVEDDQGFIWFGTQYGLNRYDGYQYKVFTHDPRHPGSLSGAYIHSLFKDRSGTLWVGDDEALDRFDPTTETFKHYTLTRESDGVPLSVAHISQDAGGTLWLATGCGVYGMDPVSGRLVHFMHSDADPFSLASNNIKFTGLDRQGRFWVVNDEGLDQFDRGTGKVVLHVPLRESREMAFHEDGHGNFWITHASGSGLALLDRPNNTLVPIAFAGPKDAGDPTVAVSAALEDREGTMWFATGGAGLLKFHREQDRMLRYRHRPGDVQSLVADNVIALFEDRADYIWAGFHAAAPSFFARHSSGFQRLPYGPMPPHSRGMVNMVNSIYEARDSTLWLSYLGTLIGVDRTTGQSVSYGEKERGGNGDVLTMAEDPSGNFWVGTVGRGLARFDPRAGRFEWFTHAEVDPNSLSNNVVTRLSVDHAGRLWAATWDGLDLVDPSRGRFVTYRPSNEPQGQMYLGIAEDAQGILWLATSFSGLHSFDPATGRFKLYRHSSAQEGTLSNNRVNAVYVDRQGQVWAGTQEGLSRLDPATGLFHTWTERDGLPGNVVSCILEDAAGNLWVSTNKGLAEFELGQHRLRDRRRVGADRRQIPPVENHWFYPAGHLVTG